MTKVLVNIDDFFDRFMEKRSKFIIKADTASYDFDIKLFDKFAEREENKPFIERFTRYASDYLISRESAVAFMYALDKSISHPEKIIIGELI